MLNTSGTLIFLGQRYVPPFVSSVDFDYLYLNAGLLEFMANINPYNIYQDQSAMFNVIFFEAYLDPLQQEAFSVMFTLSLSGNSELFNTSYARVMGTIFTRNVMANFGLKILKKAQRILVLDHFNYTKIEDNPYHASSYFNNQVDNQRLTNKTLSAS
jgi:hypothetical protein